MNAIAPIRSVPNAVGLPAVIVGEFASLPPSIKKAIAKIDLAYPAGVSNLSQGEVGLRNDVYAEAVSGFPPVVVAGALKHLLLKNPRNPFAPTPMDVNELCTKFEKRFVEALTRYMLGDDWTAPAFVAGCSAPGTPGHPLPLERVRELARATLDWSLTKSRYSLGDHHGVNAFNRVRPEMFDPGERETMVEEYKASHEILSEGRGPEYFRLRDEVAKVDRLEHSLRVQRETEFLASFRKKSLAKI